MASGTDEIGKYGRQVYDVYDVYCGVFLSQIVSYPRPYLYFIKSWIGSTAK